MNKKYYDNLFKKILNETLEEKANSLVKTLKLNKNSEFDYVQEDFDDVLGIDKFNKYDRDPEYRSRKKAKEMADRDMSKHFKSPGDPWATDVNPSEKWPKHKLPYDTKFDFEELSENEEVCNECGVGTMTEGECNECGYSKMSMEEKWDKEVEVEKTGEHADKTIAELKKELSRLKDLTQKYKEHDDRVPKAFKKRMSELIFAIRSKRDWPKGHMEESKRKKQICNECGVGTMVEGECNECGNMKEETKEGKKLSSGQKYIAGQADPKDKIDANDFKKLRTKKTETKEGKKFPDLTGDGKVTRADILKGRGVELGKKKPKVEETVYRIYSGKESAVFSESEVIDMIEQFVNEEKQNFKKGQTPAGYTAYEKAVKQSKKENDDYIGSVLKKLKDYTKPGSETTYDMNPKNFPRGNGEFKEMEKKAYEVSKDGEEFIDDYLRPGMQTLDYDEMHPNEDWMDDLIQGSSRTGNNQEWANAEQTEANEKLNKTRKKNAYNKAKRAAYNKSPQPVITDKPGQESGKGLHLKTESVENKDLIVSEEFNRMKQLMGYNQKTQ